MASKSGGLPNSATSENSENKEKCLPRMSWAERLGSTLPPKLQKNVLEVVLEKDHKGPFNVSEDDCARLMTKVGLESVSDKVEAVQICPSGKGVIYVTLKDDVDLERFCMHESFAVTQTGIRSTIIKPALKKEVIVSVKGIHPNTRDSLVLEYLAKYGRVLTTKVSLGGSLVYKHS